MASGTHGVWLQQIHRLFERGSVGGLSEWQLLDRYLTRRDESAFEALVARHGPMVLGVCRRVLDDPHAAEDAFQATFLVLVRKARSLGEHDAIGHWLYGVACRVALRARSEAARRRSLEKQVRTIEGASLGDEPGRFELATLLDGELGRLPAKYRAPVVLCYLEGLTHEEAARQLRWPVGTVKGRLARARDLLRDRLTRRGVVPTAGLLTATLGRDASAAVPESLVHATVQAAVRISAGGTAGGVVSATVARLLEGGLSTMFMTKLKIGAGVLGACGCLALGAWALGQVSQGNRPGSRDARAESKPAAHAGGARDAGAAVAEKDRALGEKMEEPIPLKFQGAPLGDVLKFIRSATQGPGDTGVPIYVEPEGLQEAGVTIDSPVTIDAKGAPLKTSLDRVLRPLKLAATIRDGLLVVSSRQEIAFIELQKLNEALRRVPGPSGDAHSAGDPGERSPAAWLKRIETQEATPEAKAKTAAILAALEKRVAMNFPNETPLEDVLKYIKGETPGKDLPNGLPIYVDPVGLQEAEKTMTSPVTLDVEGVPLKTTLRLILKQLGLVYSVKDGLLTITGESSEDTITPILELANRATLGELSFGEMNELVALFKARDEIMRYSDGSYTPPPGAPAVPAAPAAKPANAAPNNPVLSPPDDAEAAKMNAIYAALNKVVSIHFKEKPLGEAIKFVQEATKGPGLPDGVPIYIESFPLERPTEQAVTIDLDGVRLKTSLRLMLRQCRLAYVVKEGLLMIGLANSPEITSGGFGGGMGGGMGGMGGGFR